MAPPDVVDEFRRYVTNDIPIRLIDVNTLKLVDRGFVRRYFEKEIDNITDDIIHAPNRRFWRRAESVEAVVKETVTYAILSHRWLDAGEPTHKEMKKQDPASLHGPGYEKLKKFCEEAKRRSFQFAWSDTCCIDRTSSVELDESIRSMFRWYRNTALCIIHLAQTTSLDDLKEDEWFRRGWTLQELLAPKKMKFFDKTWKALTAEENDRCDDRVLKAITEATGIPRNDIHEFSPSPSRVDRKMTWAAKRITTRTEDVAYSLMGIFDVSTQIAYGEGAERAFHRLIEAIMLKGGSPSVLNFNLAHGYMPALPASPADYVGQPELIYDMNANLLDMAVTGRGLRVPLIILPLEVVSERQGRDSDWTTCRFRCPHYGIADVSASVLPAPLTGLVYEFALGIFHYTLADSGHPAVLPGALSNSTAYLLRRHKTRQHGASGSFDGYRDLALAKYSCSAWTRVQTKEYVAVVLDPPVTRYDERRYVDRSHWKTLYL